MTIQYNMSNGKPHTASMCKYLIKIHKKNIPQRSLEYMTLENSARKLI